MKAGRKKRAAPGDKVGNEERPGPEAAGLKDEESCRCKDVSKKSMSELLKVAISDLSFWKKSK